ncbi:MAG: amidohydrolase family protein [Alcanivoracaceae bacterium]|nr:amidohydrolase family protein [Alcanivoracaceae bacterium]
MRAFQITLLALLTLLHTAVTASEPTEVLFRNVQVFDGRANALTPVTDVLVRGNQISAIGSSLEAAEHTQVIDGKGRTLMPGLIDVHVHMTFSALSMLQLLAPDLTPSLADSIAAKGAEQMLLRGFTSVRDMGGPVWGLKAGIDAGRFTGPRIWPSGATISQTAGHGDMRLPHERSRRFFGEVSRAEQLGATFIADGRDEVLTATRENLRFGASQIKLMAGGGTSSAYDPVDVTQYTLDEMRAAVEAAEDWGTYVTVHAYTPRAIRRAIEAGVKSVEHGQLLDKKTLKLIAKRDVWLSTQVLMADSENMDPLRRQKRKPVIEGQEWLWPTAKQLGVKLAWGTDFLFEPDINHEQNSYLLKLLPWFTPAEILRLVTHDNAQLLALSGNRNPYPGKLGVVETGALADLILVDGDPLADLSLLADPQRNFVVIMKDGVIYKDMNK